MVDTGWVWPNSQSPSVVVPSEGNGSKIQEGVACATVDAGDLIYDVRDEPGVQRLLPGRGLRSDGAPRRDADPPAGGGRLRRGPGVPSVDLSLDEGRSAVSRGGTG